MKWLHASAGAGKTVILKTIADILHRRGLLLAAFFFRRTDLTRNNTQSLIATIAYQLYKSIPASQPYIEEAVKSDPLIFGRSIEAQAQALIITPLSDLYKAGRLPSQYARVIIIDGLDECQDILSQREVLVVLNDTIQKLPKPFAVLIASRPEHQIRKVFDLNLNHSSSRLSLDGSYRSDGDIKKFYVDTFKDIRERHSLGESLPTIWPTPKIINMLVQKASGQFIYASTVTKFLEFSPESPDDCLRVVLRSKDLGGLEPFKQLDNLYSTIFKKINEKDWAAALEILATILFQSDYPQDASPRFLESLLGIKRHVIRHLLVHLQSLLDVKPGADDYPIKILHASLTDFLFDESRSGPFFIDPGMENERLARRCLELFFAPYGN